MGYSGMKISGHSGTQFKHRKAFYNKLKPMVTGTSNTPGKDIYPEYSFSELQKARAEIKKANFKKAVLLWTPFVIALLAFCAYVMSDFETIPFSQSSTPCTPYTSTCRAERMAKLAILNSNTKTTLNYDIFVEAGNVALKENRLNDAQVDFTKALKEDNFGKEANLGLTRTLSESCRQHGKFCELASQYFDFTKGLPNVDESDLKKLGVDAFFE